MSSREEIEEAIRHRKTKIDLLRSKRADITYCLEWEIKELERLRRHLAVAEQRKGGDGSRG